MQTFLEANLAPDTWWLYSLEKLKLDDYFAAAVIADVYWRFLAGLCSLGDLFVPMLPFLQWGNNCPNSCWEERRDFQTIFVWDELRSVLLSETQAELFCVTQRVISTEHSRTWSQLRVSAWSSSQHFVHLSSSSPLHHPEAYTENKSRK